MRESDRDIEKLERNMNRNRNKSNIFLLMVLSAFSGFFLGLFLAPYSGRVLRKKLGRSLDDIIDRGKFTWLEARIIGEGFLEKSKEQAEKVSSRIKTQPESEKSSKKEE